MILKNVHSKSPQPTYSNIIRLKAGAAGAVSKNEKLAYELQAIELEISLVSVVVNENIVFVSNIALKDLKILQMFIHITVAHNRNNNTIVILKNVTENW